MNKDDFERPTSPYYDGSLTRSEYIDFPPEERGPLEETDVLQAAIERYEAGVPIGLTEEQQCVLIKPFYDAHIDIENGYPTNDANNTLLEIIGMTGTVGQPSITARMKADKKQMSRVGAVLALAEKHDISLQKARFLAADKYPALGSVHTIELAMKQYNKKKPIDWRKKSGVKNLIKRHWALFPDNG